VVVGGKTASTVSDAIDALGGCRGARSRLRRAAGSGTGPLLVRKPSVLFIEVSAKGSGHGIEKSLRLLPRERIWVVDGLEKKGGVELEAERVGLQHIRLLRIRPRGTRVACSCTCSKKFKISV